MVLDILVTVLVYTSYSVIFLGVGVSLLAFLNKLKYRRYKFTDDFRPSVSFITPAYNEEQFIENTIKKYLKTTYPESLKEMIVVNDGSKDRTREIVEKYASRIINAETGSRRYIPGRKGRITLVNRKLGGKGKAYALNDGIKYARGEIYLITDGDIELSPNMFGVGLRHFSDPGVGIVIGFVSVKKTKRSILNNYVDYEFFSGQALQRRGYNVLGSHYIIPGGMSFFRKGVIEEAGGYKSRTLAEDTDLTFDILMDTKWKIHYEMNAKVWSNEPTRLKNLWDQRVRWARGNIQVTWLHKNKVGRPKHGRSATILYPFWLAHIVLPIAFIIGTSGIMLSILLNVGIPYPSFLKDMLLFSFFGIWLIVSIMYRFRSSFEGLTNPGFVMLAGFISFLFFDRGIFGIFESIGLPGPGYILGIAISVWLFIGIPGSYLSLWISKKHERVAQFLQLGVFGYWMFLVAASFQGYVQEIRRNENVWIKTKK